MQQEKLLVNTVHLRDIDEQAGMLPDWTQEYQQLGHGKFAGTLAYAEADQFTLIRETSNQALHQNISPPSDQIVVGMCLQGVTTCNGKQFAQNGLFVADGQLSYDIRTEGYVELLGLSMKRDYFFSRLREQDANIAGDSVSATITELDPRAATMLRQTFLMVSDILQNREDAWGYMLAPRLLAGSMLGNIALAVSLSRPEHYVDAVPKSQQRRDRIVQHAIEYMRKNASEEIGILDICDATHVSRRTLQYCFEERLNISPLQYLKALRLNQARRQLKQLIEMELVHERENTIASVAALCGFNHASRFASDYKRMFGELPSKISL